MEDRSMIFAELERHLDGRGVGHAVLERAAVEPLEVCRSELLDVDGRHALAALPEPYAVDYAYLAELIGADRVRPCDAAAVAQGLPDHEPGALPPFGNLWRLPVYLDCSLVERDWLICLAGRHDRCLQLRLVDYIRLVHPVAAEFAIPRLPARRRRKGAWSSA